MKIFVCNRIIYLEATDAVLDELLSITTDEKRGSAKPETTVAPEMLALKKRGLFLKEKIINAVR